MRIVCSLVLITVIFQLELFIILNVNYRNVCSSNRPQLRVLPGSSISAQRRVDFRNWQVDYSQVLLEHLLTTSSLANMAVFAYPQKEKFSKKMRHSDCKNMYSSHFPSTALLLRYCMMAESTCCSSASFFHRFNDERRMQQ